MPNFDANFKMPLDEAVAAYENLVETIEANVTALGATKIERPFFNTANGPVWCEGTLPSNLTQMTDEELGAKLGEITAAMNYWMDQIGPIDNMKTVVEQQLETVSSQLRLLYSQDLEGKKTTDQQRKDLMRCDRRFVQANARFMYYEAVYNIIKSKYTQCEQSYAAVSRRITQRGQDIERDRRGATVASLQGPPTFRRPGG